MGNPSSFLSALETESPSSLKDLIYYVASRVYTPKQANSAKVQTGMHISNSSLFNEPAELIVPPHRHQLSVAVYL